MAGDWIKVEHATLDKPEVIRIADLLGVPVEHAVGILLRFWVWVDRNMRNASVTHMYAKSLDTVTACAGFSGAMVSVGWAELDHDTGILTVPNIERHNGMPAKTRALARNRAQSFRNASVTETELPEKRREEKRSTTTLSGKPDLTPYRSQAKDALNRLNTLSGHNYRPVPANIDPIIARLKEGYTERDLRVVIGRKVNDWKGDEKMAEFLRPKTLFNRTNFATYAGQIPPLEAVS